MNKRNITTSLIVAAMTALLSAGCVKKESAEAANQPTDNVAEWANQGILYEVNIRQYTPEGTFNAFAAHLPRLKELGVDIVWLMPVNPISEKGKKGTLGSYYSVADYKGVNPQFGTEEDLRLLIGKAHDLGLKVIIDWVANHTGCDNKWTTEHPDWYVKTENGDFSSPYDWTDTYELDYDNKEMRLGMIDAMKYWVNEYKIDGFRCDVAYEVPYDFWPEARQALDSIRPLFMLAESEQPALQRTGAFDMCYNWPLKNIMLDIVKGENNAAGIDTLFAGQESRFPKGNIMLNHLTNHDLNSWDGSEIERFGEEATKAYAALSYTLPGMPLLYTGQETGMSKRLEFFEKDTVGSWEANSWTKLYTKLGEIRHKHRALNSYTAWSEAKKTATGDDNILAFERKAGDDKVMVIANLSNESKQIDGKISEGYTNIALAEKYTSENGSIKLDGWGYVIMTK